MFASRQIEIPLYRGIGRLSERELGALSQIFERTEISFLRRYVVAAAKHVSADLLDFAVPEATEVACGWNNFKTVAKYVGKRTLRNLLGSGSRETTASGIISSKSSKQACRSCRDIFTNIFH